MTSLSPRFNLGEATFFWTIGSAVRRFGLHPEWHS